MGASSGIQRRLISTAVTPRRRARRARRERGTRRVVLGRLLEMRRNALDQRRVLEARVHAQATTVLGVLATSTVLNLLVLLGFVERTTAANLQDT